jgi:L-asparaginase II
MEQILVHHLRADLVESRHAVRAAVVNDRGDLVAASGPAGDLVFWRSTAKPFQLWPLVAGGGVERFGLESRHLALACASHNAEAVHRDVAEEWLAKLGLREDDLSCGGHPSLSAKVAEAMIRDGITATPLWSNCSGKHAAMLGLALLRGWPTAGYQRRGHPVQDAVEFAIGEWSGVSAEGLHWGIDGCTAAAVASPLASIATAWARLGTTQDPAMHQIRNAMLAHPYLVAGQGRLDTVLMEAWPGRVLAKVGAEGVFTAALPTLGLGLALKVEDGDNAAAAVALVALLDQVTRRLAPGGDWPFDALARWRAPAIRDTRGNPTGRVDVQGTLHFA